MSEANTAAPAATPSVAESLMDNYFASIPATPKEGEIVEGTVSAIGRARVYIDIMPFGTGIMYGREYMNARDILRKVSVGDTIAAKVVTLAMRMATSNFLLRRLVKPSSGLMLKKQLSVALS
jgi:ribosomal protein S1